MSEINSLREFLYDELRDLYDAEKRLIKALPKMIKNATDDGLASALEAHLGETSTQVERLKRAFEMLDEPSDRKACAGMKGIIEEALDHMSEEYDPHELLDLAIVGSAQRVEHYEIAAYSIAIAHAKGIGKTQLAELLEESLREEQAAAEKLTAIGAPLIAAAHDASDDAETDGDDDEDEDDDEDDDEDEDDKEEEDEEEDDKELEDADDEKDVEKDKGDVDDGDKR